MGISMKGKEGQIITNPFIILLFRKNSGAQFFSLKASIYTYLWECLLRLFRFDALEGRIHPLICNLSNYCPSIQESYLKRIKKEQCMQEYKRVTDSFYLSITLLYYLYILTFNFSSYYNNIWLLLQKESSGCYLPIFFKTLIS